MAEEGGNFGRLRSSIEKKIEQAKEERKRDMFRRRIDIARLGVVDYENKKFVEATKSFHAYIQILEEWKKVPPGGLTPSNFDKKLDIPELLLITGVFWDLVKLYDRTKGERAYKEFKLYLSKYVLFVKGMPFEGLCLETMRKYIQLDKPAHRADFKEAYKKMGGSKCFIAGALLDEIEVETIPALRRYRDERLSRSIQGRLFIFVYYAIGPGCAWIVERLPRHSRAALGFALNRLSRRL
jgi:hypothetical protein